MLVPSHSNDTWYVRSAGADAVLRVCWIGDRRRLLREAAVGAVLPPEVGYPEVLGSGTVRAADVWLTWVLTRRLGGTSLAAACIGPTFSLYPAIAERPLRSL